MGLMVVLFWKNAGRSDTITPMIDKRSRLVLVVVLFFGWPAALAAQASWDFEKLSKAPAVHPAPGFEAAGMKALFYEGVPWKGNPTRIFAWYGAPKAEG